MTGNLINQLKPIYNNDNFYFQEEMDVERMLMIGAVTLKLLFIPLFAYWFASAFTEENIKIIAKQASKNYGINEKIVEQYALLIAKKSLNKWDSDDKKLIDKFKEELRKNDKLEMFKNELNQVEKILIAQGKTGFFGKVSYKMNAINTPEESIEVIQFIRNRL